MIRLDQKEWSSFKHVDLKTFVNIKLLWPSTDIFSSCRVLIVYSPQTNIDHNLTFDNILVVVWDCCIAIHSAKFGWHKFDRQLNLALSLPTQRGWRQSHRVQTRRCDFDGPDGPLKLREVCVSPISCNLEMSMAWPEKMFFPESLILAWVKTFGTWISISWLRGLTPKLPDLIGVRNIDINDRSSGNHRQCLFTISSMLKSVRLEQNFTLGVWPVSSAPKRNIADNLGIYLESPNIRGWFIRVYHHVPQI